MLDDNAIEGEFGCGNGVPEEIHKERHTGWEIEMEFRDYLEQLKVVYENLGYDTKLIGMERKSEIDDPSTS